MKKEYSLAINKLNQFMSDKKYIGVLLLLRSDEILHIIQEFMDTKSKRIDDEMLDNMKDIIVAAKTIYEIERYADPYPDDFYDSFLSKFKKFRSEVFAETTIGVADAKYKYDVLSGTLDKAHFIYTSERPERDMRLSLEEWFESLPVNDDYIFSVLVNQKKDGTSVTIDYQYDGNNSYIAKSGISRGKKDYGEGTDVSVIIPTEKFNGKEIKNLLGYYPEYIGVQYEFLISNEDKKRFEKYLSETTKGTNSFANNRSAATGLLRRMLFASKKELQTLKSFMSLVPVGFDVLDEYKTKGYRKTSWGELYESVCSTFIFGSVSMSYEYLTGTKKSLLKQFESLAKTQLNKRSSLNHAIDGLVITILDNDLIRVLGRRNNINKYQVAYKFPEEGYKTVVRDFIITTGNFGYKEILLKVDPVVLNGTVQEKAQVHSLKKFNKMKLRIGDEIILKLSGDVIPFGYKDDTCAVGTGKKIKLPEYCECGAPLEEEKNKLRCTNPRCPFRIIGSLTTFFTEINAKGIGEKTCAQLYYELGIEKPSDILKLTKEDFKKLKGFKDASAEACMETIRNILSKPRTIPAILSALGIDSFRASTAEKLLNITSINHILELIDRGHTHELLSLVKRSDGIDKNASNIVEGLLDKADELKKLLSMMTIKEQDNTSYDKTILISGIRHDDELENIANKAGYQVKDSGKKFDILVIKDESMLDKSKAVYAKSHNIPIMTRREFIERNKPKS